MDNAVKFVDGHDDLIEGMLAPFGGPIAGKDLDGEFFSPRTDFALEWFGDWQRPLLFGHGYDPEIKTSVVGRIKVEPTDKGIWMRAQLDKKHAYYEQIRGLVEDGLGLSSGAVDHLTDINTKSGEIMKWPLIEGSLTPTPANPDATAKYAAKSADIAEHLAVLGVAVPDALADVEAEASAPDIEPATKSTDEQIIELLTAIKSLLEPKPSEEVVPPAPLLAIAGKSAEPEETFDPDAFARELTELAIKQAKDIISG